MVENFSTYYASPVGALKIVATDTYVKELSFVHKDKTPVTSFPEANVNPVVQECLDQLIEYFNGSRRVFDIPVHQEGTSFQTQVWGELLNIPFGKTISYLELSKRIGDPKAIRAAASTNGKNNIAIIVPCHRVIGSNQELVGYGGGVWRKRWLLEHENKIANGVQTLF